MYKINLIPQIGVHIEGIGQVNFGQTRDEIVNVFGNYNSINNEADKRVEYANYGFFADFHKQDDTFEAVEFWNDLQENKSEVYIYDKEILNTEAKILIELLQIQNNNEPSKDGWFINIDAFYSGGSQKHIKATIDQAKKDGLYFGENKEILLKELNQAKYFTSFGIGYKNYCKNGLELIASLLKSN
jgi:hypothetical protein